MIIDTSLWQITPTCWYSKYIEIIFQFWKVRVVENIFIVVGSEKSIVSHHFVPQRDRILSSSRVQRISIRFCQNCEFVTPFPAWNSFVEFASTFELWKIEKKIGFDKSEVISAKQYICYRRRELNWPNDFIVSLTNSNFQLFTFLLIPIFRERDVQRVCKGRIVKRKPEKVPGIHCEMKYRREFLNYLIIQNHLYWSKRVKRSFKVT